jgi:hypothetical protein
MTSRRSRPKTNPFADDDDSYEASTTSSAHRSNSTPNDPRLTHYETLLSKQIDPDFFSPPQNFHALSRVIDILGVSLQNNHNGFGSPVGSISHEVYSNNHAYRSLQSQQALVEEAIEHMAVRHCADLNLSVSAVGRMSRQFDEAKSRVEALRVQVGSVGDSLRLGEVGGLVRWWMGSHCLVFMCLTFPLTAIIICLGFLMIWILMTDLFTNAGFCIR